MSLLIAIAIAALPSILNRGHERSDALHQAAREAARTFLVHNPQLEIDSVGSLILDPHWLVEMRSAAAESEGNSTARVDLPVRMLARSQARLDALIADVHALRIKSDPAWRFGVLDARSPAENYFIHALVHENKAGIVLAIAVLLLVGIALESNWGSLIFSAFVFAVVPMTAQGYRLLDAWGGVPWSGAAGLAGALLGAYFIRGLGGQFLIPGWILLPAWLGVESFVVRGLSLDNLGSAPWATFCASVGIGALVAGGLRMTDFESRASVRTSNRGPNPVVSRAARLRSDGDPSQAFDLIQAAWREDPTSQEIADCFFSIAVEVGQPGAAAEAILPSLSQLLREGETAQAIEIWLPLATIECDARLEATVAVKLGEALLDAGHPDEALFTLRNALEGGVSGVHAARIARIARDLDEVLARRAALVALDDASLDAKLQAELERMVTVSNDQPPEEDAERISPAMVPRSGLDRPADGEDRSADSTAPSIEADSGIDPEAQSGLGEADPNEVRLSEQSLDAGALSMDQLASDSSAAPVSPSSQDEPAENSSDVLSHWNDDPRSSKDASPENDAPPPSRDASPKEHGLGDEFDDATLFNTDELAWDEAGFDFGSNGDGQDLFDPLDSETDADLTPLMDVTDELTSHLEPNDATTAMTSYPNEQSATVFDQPTMYFKGPVEKGPVESPPDSETLSISPAGDSASPSEPPLRSLNALEAIPIATNDEWIEVDASPRGKSKLPFWRIQSLAMAAVRGLGDRPVLVIDCVLNRSNRMGEEMKAIRFRSDRFDPARVEPGAPTPLAALTAWVNRVQASSNANCLPSREFLEGGFARFDSLEDYEREVLGAVRRSES